MASRALGDLHPQVRERVVQFLHLCDANQIDILVTCTWRSPQEQDKLYAIGRTEPGRIITNARAGQSLHNWMTGGTPASRAIDVVPLVDGKPVWDDKDPLWQSIGRLGEAAGLEWAGRWKKFKEYPHFQLRAPD
jgi:peptidoglycan L-alanyl-D-glutamate endopeptidase CwlK